MHAPDAVDSAADAFVVQRMQNWLTRAVIGLNLCPFAKAVHVKEQIHYAVCRAAGKDAEEILLQALAKELRDLLALDAEVRDTTVLIAPDMLGHFLDFNDFLGRADDLLVRMELEGEIQIASFHPLYQFGGTDADDIANYTNRAPYPTLHLLREDSIDRAVEAFPEAEAIYERNMQTLEQLGQSGWDALDLGAVPHKPTSP
ncbi:DUF1415 domain-containing protein [Variovorax sp. HJSM1_2]|uniref:DUF1415 domain-containing protein n=1 Tax=Variovorax sp. HJSM1_2 TaxID=3366263 RepID=UPI003BCDAEC1